MERIERHGQDGPVDALGGVDRAEPEQHRSLGIDVDVGVRGGRQLAGGRVTSCGVGRVALRLRLAALIERDEPDDQRHDERHGDRRELGAESAVRSGLAIDAFLRLEFLAGANARLASRNSVSNGGIGESSRAASAASRRTPR